MNNSQSTKYFIEKGVPVKYISPINEPQWSWGGDWVGQEGCHYEPEQALAVFKVFAQKIKESGGYHDDFYVVSFSGFFPAENPKIVITVVIDGPRYRAERWVVKRDARGRIMYYPNGTKMMEQKVVPTRAYGGTVAAPVFKEIAEKTIRWLEIPPSKQ